MGAGSGQRSARSGTSSQRRAITKSGRARRCRRRRTRRALQGAVNPMRRRVTLDSTRSCGRPTAEVKDRSRLESTRARTLGSCSTSSSRTPRAPHGRGDAPSAAAYRRWTRCRRSASVTARASAPPRHRTETSPERGWTARTHRRARARLSATRSRSARQAYNSPRAASGSGPDGARAGGTDTDSTTWVTDAELGTGTVRRGGPRGRGTTNNSPSADGTRGERNPAPTWSRHAAMEADGANDDGASAAGASADGAMAMKRARTMRRAPDEKSARRRRRRARPTA